MADEMDILEGQDCPMCGQKTLTLTERTQDVPYFGEVHIFAMTCENCKFHKSDIETKDDGEPSKYTLDVTCEDDMKIRIVKSSNATLKIPRMFSMTPGPASQGFVTNVEGVLNRVKYAIESAAELSEDPDAKKKSKNLLKKVRKVIWGQEPIKIIIEDPSGNSAIISDKAVKSKL
ncbi:ZPR1 zinc finger domain-containing protein [Candidatus Woesearchaeota archaeon]|nr:ZPR1 zinc finger domain-containing protein [Candidatus Woesearchaeota archaeon]